MAGLTFVSKGYIEPTLILDQTTLLPNSQMLDKPGKIFKGKTL